MSSVFPGAIDDFDTSMTSGGLMNSPSHAAQHQKIGDALEKVQTELATGVETSGRLRAAASSGQNQVVLRHGSAVPAVGDAILIGATQTTSELLLVSSVGASGADTLVTFASNLSFARSAGDSAFVVRYTPGGTLIPCALTGMIPGYIGVSLSQAQTNQAIFTRYFGYSPGYCYHTGTGLQLDNYYSVSETCPWESGLVLMGTGYPKGAALWAHPNFSFSPLVYNTVGTAVLRAQRQGDPTRYLTGPQTYLFGGGFTISGGDNADATALLCVTNQPHAVRDLYIRQCPGRALACGGSDGGKWDNINFDTCGQNIDVSGSKSIYFTDTVAASQVGGTLPWFSARATVGCVFRGLYPETSWGAASPNIDYSGAIAFRIDSFYSSGPARPFTGDAAELYSDATVPSPGNIGASYSITAAWAGDPTAVFWRDVARGITKLATDNSQDRVLMQIKAQGYCAEWDDIFGSYRKTINASNVSDYIMEGLKSVGSPNGVVSAAGVGSQCIDVSSGVPYYKTTAAGTATGWVAY